VGRNSRFFQGIQKSLKEFRTFFRNGENLQGISKTGKGFFYPSRNSKNLQGIQDPLKVTRINS
jgi:hypothetical protein